MRRTLTHEDAIKTLQFEIEKAKQADTDDDPYHPERMSKYIQGLEFAIECLEKSRANMSMG